MRSQLPNTITLFNLFFGCCALLLVLAGRPDLALWCLLGCFACDTADGLVARALNVHSPLGKQLDSLADVVSFGVVPGAMLYFLLARHFYAFVPGTIPVSLEALPGFVLSMFAAYRLGKFNVDTRQTDYFIGLSTPACTVFILGVCLGAFHNRFGLGDLLLANPWIVYALTALFSWLMVSEIPLAGMKIKRFGWKGNEALILHVVLFLALLFVVRELAFSLIILVYIVYSLTQRNKLQAAENA